MVLLTYLLTYRSLSLRKIWLESMQRFRCYALTVQEYTQGHCVKTWRHPQNRKYISSQRRQRRTEPRPQATCIKIWWWRSVVWFSTYASGQTDRHTHHNTAHPSRGRSNNVTVKLRSHRTNWTELDSGPRPHQFNSLQLVRCERSLTGHDQRQEHHEIFQY